MRITSLFFLKFLLKESVNQRKHIEYLLDNHSFRGPNFNPGFTTLALVTVLGWIILCCEGGPGILHA